MNLEASARTHWCGVALALVLAAPTSAHAQMPSIGSDSPWVLASSFYPPGALIAFEGDPNQVMPFRVELAFPRGYRMWTFRLPPLRWR